MYICIYTYTHLFIFLCVLHWSSKIRHVDLQFGFYVNFPPYNRLQRSGNRNPDQTNHLYYNDFGYFRYSLKHGCDVS